MIAINPVTVGHGDRQWDRETDRHANSATSKDTKGYSAAAATAAAANNTQASSRNRAKLTDHQQAASSAPVPGLTYHYAD